jgi:hypothetical protein
MHRGWSFCIVTAPNNEVILEQCIEKIHSEFNNNYEIIVVGNANIKNKELLFNVRILPFSEYFFSPSFSIKNIKIATRQLSFKKLFFKPGAISHKKNLAVKNARYDKVCIMHDYIGLESGWKEGFDKFGNDWDVSLNIVLNKDGTRHRDWMVFDYPNIGPSLIPYDKHSKYAYISGAYFCVKKVFFSSNQLDEGLFWGEGEDVEWSKRIRNKTTFKMNIFSVVRYLKMKPLTQGPYTDKWNNNQLKILERIKNNTFE